MGQHKNSSRRLVKFVEVLEKLFIAGPANKQSLTDEECTDRNIRRILTKAISMNLIEEKQYKEKYGKRNRTHKYYQLTQAGISFLTEHGNSPWTRMIPSTTKTIVYFDENRHQNGIVFTIRCNNAIIMARNIGADVSQFVFSGRTNLNHIAEQQDDSSTPQISLDEFQEDRWWANYDEKDSTYQYEDDKLDEDDFDLLMDEEDASSGIGIDEPMLSGSVREKEDREVVIDKNDPEIEILQGSATNNQKSTSVSTRFADLKNETWRKMKIANCEAFCEADTKSLYFFPAREVKQALVNLEKDVSKFTDFTYSQYTGLLVGQYQSMILYHAKHDGIGWNLHVERKDIRTMRQFSVKCSPINNFTMNNIRGAIIFYNAKNFADIIYDRCNRRKQNSEIGSEFTSIHGIPLSSYGTGTLRWLMTSTEKARMAYEEKLAVKCGLQKNRGRYTGAFDFVDGDEYVLNGTELEIKHIYNAIDAASAGAKFKVMCFDWQADFFRAIWPGVEIIYAG